jgi:hypothetical protein
VVTASLASQHSDIANIPLLNNGTPVSLATTLRELKHQIATSLNESVHLPEHDGLKHECNCSLAQSISRHGTWDMLRCRDQHQRQSDYPHEDLDGSAQCVLCHMLLSHPCRRCQEGESDEKYCALVINAGCKHTFHHHCYITKNQIGGFLRDESCPQGCSQGLNIS